MGIRSQERGGLRLCRMSETAVTPALPAPSRMRVPRQAGEAGLKHRGDGAPTVEVAGAWALLALRAPPGFGPLAEPPMRGVAALLDPERGCLTPIALSLGMLRALDRSADIVRNPFNSLSIRDSPTLSAAAALRLWAVGATALARGLADGSELEGADCEAGADAAAAAVQALKWPFGALLAGTAACRAQGNWLPSKCPGLKVKLSAAQRLRLSSQNGAAEAAKAAAEAAAAAVGPAAQAWAALSGELAALGRRLGTLRHEGRDVTAAIVRALHDQVSRMLHGPPPGCQGVENDRDSFRVPEPGHTNPMIQGTDACKDACLSLAARAAAAVLGRAADVVRAWVLVPGGMHRAHRPTLARSLRWAWQDRLLRHVIRITFSPTRQCLFPSSAMHMACISRTAFFTKACWPVQPPGLTKLVRFTGGSRACGTRGWEWAAPVSGGPHRGLHTQRAHQSALGGALQHHGCAHGLGVLKNTTYAYPRADSNMHMGSPTCPPLPMNSSTPWMRAWRPACIFM